MIKSLYQMILTSSMASRRQSAAFRDHWLLLAILLFAMGPTGELRAQNRSAASSTTTKLEGKVLTESGEAVSGATVWLEFPSDNTALETATAADGAYAFAVPRAGSYRLKVMKNGFRDLGLGPLSIADGETKRADITLESVTGKPADPVKNPATRALELSDVPNYTVAGVTDWSNVGLHGSDANVRTSEKLTKETAALKPATAAAKSGTPSPADVHRILGDEKEKGGDPVGALSEYEKALKLEPSEENYFAWSAELLMHRGGVAAVDAFKKGVTAHPKSVRMIAGLAAAYYADGQYPEAAERMCEASDLAPKEAAPYLFLGSMEKASTELQPCAEMRLKRYAAAQPDNPLANFYYGLVLWKIARASQSAEAARSAETHIRKAVAIAPNFAEAYVQLGLLDNAEGDRLAAVGEFQKAVTANPKLATAHYNLSLALRRVGEMEKAEQEMNIYDELHKSEEAELVRERREMRQFVTILRDEKQSPPR